MFNVLPLLNRNNAFLHSIAACIIGFSAWYLISGARPVRLRTHVSLAFIAHDHQHINAPEKIILTLEGPRSELYRIDTRDLHLHLDVSSWPDGSYRIRPRAQDLFLPRSIRVVHYAPLPIIVSLSKRS